MRRQRPDSAPSIVLVLATMLASSANAQAGPRAVQLGPARGAAVVGNEPSVLELSSGVVVATMMGVRGVVLTDFDRGRADTVGRLGAGPGEFESPRAVLPWGPGKFAVVDVSQSRLSVYVEPSRFDSIIAVPPGQQPMSLRANPGDTWFSVGAPNRKDSMPLLKSVGPSGPRDTIAWIARPPSRITPIGRGSAVNLPTEYAPKDVWGLLPDGRIWIARGGDNRVDWITADGRMRRGTPVEFPRIRTVDADRHRFHGLPAPQSIDTVNRAIADVKAPFQDVVAGPDGELWFWLNQPAGYKTERYRRIDARGTPLPDVELPLSHKVLSVSRRNVYVVHMNDDEEFVLTRHTKP